METLPAWTVRALWQGGGNDVFERFLTIKSHILLPVIFGRPGVWADPSGFPTASAKEMQPV
jgi:hypothetical protein